MQFKKLSTCFLDAIYMLVSTDGFAASDDKWGGYVESFAKPGTERSLAKGDMFIPLKQNKEFLSLANIRAVM